MNADDAEICRVGNLEADFQQNLLVQFFLKFSQYCCETLMIRILQRKVISIFLDKKKKKKKKSLFYRNCIVQTTFWL